MKIGWEAKPIGEVCALLNRGISPKYLEDGGVCVVNQKCIRDHRVSYEQSRRHDVEAKAVSAQSEPFYAVRPELVEGTNRAQDKPIEGNEPSIHPSTVRQAHSSGRTDGERSL